MRIFVVPLLLLVACLGCRPDTVSPSDTELREKLRAIALSDGVSQSEAKIIARSYFARHVGCGAFTGIRDGGKRWIVDGMFGAAGEPIQGFFIEKRSGKVTSPVGPSYEDPLKIFP